MVATATDMAGNRTEVEISFVVTIPAVQLRSLFDDLLIEHGEVASELAPLVDDLSAGGCAGGFVAYAAAVREQLAAGTLDPSLSADVYSLGVAICRA